MCVFSWYEKRNDKFLVHYTGPVVFMAIRARRTKTSIVNEGRIEMVSEGVRIVCENRRLFKLFSKCSA